jgi:hypothetical protein
MDKGTGQLNIVDVRNLMAFPFSLGSAFQSNMLPQSASDVTFEDNTR